MKKINKILLIIFIILIIITIIIYIMYKKSNNNEIQEIKEENAKTYYDYFDDNGLINKEFIKDIELPENYKNIKLQKNTIDDFLEIIISKTKVDIPEQLIHAYKYDEYKQLEAEADAYNRDLKEHLKEQYGVETIEEYWEKNEEEYKKIIKEDLVYQKLAENLNIKITDEDIKKEYSNLISEGKTMEDIKENYGEKLVYKYTIIYKIKETLLNR